MENKKIVDDVFARISELYKCANNADIGRKLGGMSHQNVYTYRARGNVPYRHIIDNTPPEDWPYIFLGTPRSEPSSVEGALKLLADLGYRVTLEKREH